jgi:phosphoserine phosphatase
MKIKAIIIDFDGTITTRDMSDLLAQKACKEKESAELNQLFWEGKLGGITGLVQRINFLKGLSLDDLEEIVAEDDYLRPGTKELFEYCRAHNIITIIASGSILPFLKIYQDMLGADYLVGSNPRMENGKIVSISEQDYSGPDFKVQDSRVILSQLGIDAASVIAIGDSPADRGIFEFAAASIAINPKAGVEEYADYRIEDDLSEAIPIIENLKTRLEP